MTTTQFQVTGMTCGHCAMSVREEVQEVAGVTGVEVSHQSGQLTVTSDLPVDEAAVVAAVEEAQAALRIDPSNLAMAGLGVAALGGIGAAFAGQPFFTGQWLFLFRDGDSYVPLSTVLVFDIGVYMAVFGGILTLVFALEQEI